MIRQPGIPARRVPSSFRDPAGFVFERAGVLYRQVNHAGVKDYEHLMRSGLYSHLVDRGLLIAHREVDVTAAQPALACKVLMPDLVPFVSYPYEWSFSQLKAAALVTLQVQEAALEFGMTLKDASAFNIQFREGQAVLIDTLSFQEYQGRPWDGYQQFCQHFLGPLLLAAKIDPRLVRLLRIHIDGIPLDLVSRLVPFHKTALPVWVHIHVHSRIQRRAAVHVRPPSGKAATIGPQRAILIVDSLRRAVESLDWKPTSSDWLGYYSDAAYAEKAFHAKRQIVAEWTDKVQPGCVWDLGSNIGLFSRITAGKGALTVAIDSDIAAVEENYREVQRSCERLILPLWMDLTNPSPALGWSNRERASLLDRGPADLTLALALLHHLVIRHNISPGLVAEFLASTARYVIIEFVPKRDPQVQRMLHSRCDIFSDYNRRAFEQAFEQYFAIVESRELPDSERSLYLMERLS